LTWEHASDPDAIFVTLSGDCDLLGVKPTSFVPGALGEHMTVRHDTFAQHDSRTFSIAIDVSGVPLDELASIGFSSYGVVDSCTNEMLALVDPLVFRLSSRHEGGRRL